MSVLTVYPERRRVPEETVIGWADDSWVNNADIHICDGCGLNVRVETGVCDHYDHGWTPVYSDGQKRPETLAECMAWLSDMGEVTFATPIGCGL